jgi:hypothetical protein
MELAKSVQSIASAERAVALMIGHCLRSMRDTMSETIRQE